MCACLLLHICFRRRCAIVCLAISLQYTSPSWSLSSLPTFRNWRDYLSSLSPPVAPAGEGARRPSQRRSKRHPRNRGRARSGRGRLPLPRNISNNSLQTASIAVAALPRSLLGGQRGYWRQALERNAVLALTFHGWGTILMGVSHGERVRVAGDGFRFAVFLFLVKAEKRRAAV